MAIPIADSQQELLDLGQIDPRLLVTITNRAGIVLRFCNRDALTDEDGNIYQPYVEGISGFSSSVNFPENKAGVHTLSVTMLNDPITFQDTEYTHLSKTLDVIDWEMADCDIELILVSGTEGNVIDRGIAMPIMSSGIVGVPQGIGRDVFSLTVSTRNSKLNDLIPLRAVTDTDFPTADPDELNGRTYIPIIVGSGVRIRAISTAAGAVTTVRTEVAAGATLEVSDVSNFNDSDTFIIGGVSGTVFTVGTVSTADNSFTSITPDLNTAGVTWNVGDVVNQDLANYDYTIADHKIGEIASVFVKKRGDREFTLIDNSLWSKNEVADSAAISGTRTDLRITELTPIGGGTSGSVSTQPDHTVDGGSHNHAVALTGASSTSEHFAGSMSPTAGDPANDGNAATFVTVGPGGTVDQVATFATHGSLSGSFDVMRYFMIASNTVFPGGDIRMRRGSTNFLTLSSTFGLGEFRSAEDDGTSPNADESDDWNLNGNEDSGAINLYEGWKLVTMNPTVSETTQDLSATTIITNVAINVTGANLEIGDVVEVVCSGIQAEDWTADLGTGTVDRPDRVMRWFIQEALGQTAEIIDEDSYADAAIEYDNNEFKIQLAVQKPITVDSTFDQIANASRSMHWWGRYGHKLKFLDIPAVSGTFVEDEEGVLDIFWQHSTASKDLRNRLSAFFGRDWTTSANKDESYTGLVSVAVSGSITRFGELPNEVRGQEKEFFFDLIPSQSQMADVLSFITTQKAFPRKRFQIKTTPDHMNIEPGDIVDVRTFTLNGPIKARVVENKVDSRYFAQITAVEVEESDIAFTVTEKTKGGEPQAP